MDLTGKIVSILPEQRFNGKEGEVVKNQFVVETNGQYPKKVCFQVIGADRFEKIRQYVVNGADVQVFFDVSSREYQGRWFTQCDAYRVNPLSAVGGQQQSSNTQQQAVQSTQQAAAPASTSGSDDDSLPF